ncbi:trehalose-phosphatase [Aquibium microcysteis]|uniref:trehalose-phosphatase n=1 Tax=Aquibium microcysteis TaxID=675281 RepID=UPI00165D1212|nr:trehalose-phosphatase [Aquibium microcysteis]
MPEDLTELNLPPEETAFFFDFDGTLAEIVEDPAAVAIDATVRHALHALFALSGGAVAIVSGREIDTLDGFLAPLRLPLGGAHGSERRDSSGRLHRVEADEPAIERLAAELEDVARRHDGLLVERKRLSVALHYRRRPDLESTCRAAARAAASPGVTLLEGKMVVELKLSGRTKGDLIADFMAEEPFRGRRPIFFGDDVTDEDGFRALPQWQGIGVKVGQGQTAAAHRIADPAALRAWLQRFADRNGTRRVELAS